MPTTGMPWVKIWVELLDDGKFLEYPRSCLYRYIELIMIAGECDAEGYLVSGNKPLNTKYLSWRLRSTEQEIDADIANLIEIGVLERHDNTLFIPKFTERQDRRQSTKREQWRIAQQNYRQKKVKDESSDDMPDDTHQTSDKTSENVNDDVILDNSERQVLRHTPREEKSREEREKSREEGTAQAPDPSTPTTHSSKRSKDPQQPKARDPLFDAIAEVTSSNPSLLGARIAKTTNALRKISATPEQVHQVAAWFTANDWRGKKGEKLTLPILVEVWDSGIKNVPVVSQNGHHQTPNEPAGFAAIREAMKDPRYKE